MNHPILENDRLKVQTTSKAGEILSVYDKLKNREVMYQGDQGWSGRNPTLFPVVGSTWKGGSYEIDGKTYTMKNHGLIRYADLDETIYPDKIVYSLQSNDETREKYPYDFDYEMTYRLDPDPDINNRLCVDFKITNTGETDMPFSFGLHPAFKTSQSPEEAFEDFSIEYAPAGPARQIVFTPDGDPVQREDVVLDTWNLNRDDLKKYATLVYEDPKCTSATLKYKDEPRVCMTFKDYPYLAFWSHPTPSDFICIEPWYGHADYEDVEVSFDQREGTRILRPGETFTASWQMEVL